MDNTISEVVLYDVKRDNGDCFFLKAYIDSRSSNLVLSGLDYSKLAKKLYDNEEYEYYYTFSKDATEKLKTIFENSNVLDAASHFFHGDLLNRDFLAFCENNGVDYEIHVL